MAGRDIAQDCRRFGQDPVAVDQRRHAGFRIDAKELRAALLVGSEVDARHSNGAPVSSSTICGASEQAPGA